MSTNFVLRSLSFDQMCQVDQDRFIFMYNFFQEVYQLGQQVWIKCINLTKIDSS